MSDSGPRRNQIGQKELVEQIHARGRPLVIVATGGAIRGVRAVLQVLGDSATVLEIRLPQSKAEISEFLGAAPQTFCSPATARSLAMRAFWRARTLLQSQTSPAAPSPGPLGVACTMGPARLDNTDSTGNTGDAGDAGGTDGRDAACGPQRICIALQSEESTETVILEAHQRARSRGEQERLVADFVIGSIAAAVGVRLGEGPALLPGERPQRIVTQAPGEWRDLVLGRRERILAAPWGGFANEATFQTAKAAGTWNADGKRPRLIFPGAFNPLHTGHRRMAELATEIRRLPVEFELSVHNVDKPPLDFTEIATRLKQFAPGEIAWLTHAPTFAQKAALFPGSTFVVGADTITRVAHGKYYSSAQARREAIDRIARHACRFLVFGRRDKHGFCDLETLRLPATLRQLCDGIPESEFREDISSTALRQAAEQDT